MSRMNAEKSPWKPTCGQTRQLQSQVKMSHEVCSSKCRSENYRAHLMEVFSPPRLVPAVETGGFRARSYDLKSGYDLSKGSDRKRVEEDLIQNRPGLLVLSPPCTHEGGWFNLNGSKFDGLGYLQLRARADS